MRRRVEAARDQVFRSIGTDEPLFEETVQSVFGDHFVSVNWRKPLRWDEIARLALTPDVRERKGRA